MNNKSLSNTLIGLSAFATVLTYIIPTILNFGMNNYFISSSNYIFFGVQIILYQFLHGGFIHLFSNSIFLFLFGNQLENTIGRKKYMVFFILNTFFVALSLLVFSGGNTIGISGFAMALLAYIFLLLRKNKHPDYKAAGLFIAINIFIGIDSNISFVGHLSGVIFGIIFYYISSLTKK
ncbi:MAG: rhomboid family intramembrane serine protease [Candidatus Gracilibacteria bacterium]|nr:rhomboid family intramembrane serine protease [Candidatus Gracilibacteria bacterium]MDD2908268.1 rhomboid family intramembrane serine protease [Candidatus Gracilibacteria bacterium]